MSNSMKSVLLQKRNEETILKEPVKSLRRAEASPSPSGIVSSKTREEYLKSFDVSNSMKSVLPQKRNEETILKEPVKSLRRAEASPSPSGIVSSKTREQYLESFGDCPCDCPCERSDKHDLSRCAAYVFRFFVPWSKRLQPKLQLLHFSRKHRCVNSDVIVPNPDNDCLLRLEWLRINDIYSKPNPFRVLYGAGWQRTFDSVQQELSADDSNVQGQELCSREKFITMCWNGQKDPSFRLRDWYVYGYVQLCTFPSTSTKTFEVPPPSDTVWWEPSIPEDEDALVLTGPVAAYPGEWVRFRLEALPRGKDSVPIADAHPLLIAEGETPFNLYMSQPCWVESPVNTYYMEMHGTVNGNVTLCYSAINPAMVAKFYASLFTNRWGRDSRLQVTGSISVESDFTPRSAPLYLFHAHNTLVKNGGSIPLSNDYVPVIPFEKLTVRFNLSGHLEDQPDADDELIACYSCILCAIADGDEDSLMKHNDIEDARHESVMESVDGVELMAAFLSFNKETYSGDVADSP